VLPQNAPGKWVAHYVDHGTADRFAHAEVYCALALHYGEPWSIA